MKASGLEFHASDYCSSEFRGDRLLEASPSSLPMFLSVNAHNFTVYIGVRIVEMLQIHVNCKNQIMIPGMLSKVHFILLFLLPHPHNSVVIDCIFFFGLGLGLG